MKRRAFLQLAGIAAAAVTVNGVNLGALATADPVGAGFDTLGEDLLVGDVLTFAGRFAVNPVTRHATTHLQHFVVTAIHRDSIDLTPQPRPALTPANTLIPLGAHA